MRRSATRGRRLPERRVPHRRERQAAGHLTGGCRRNRDWLAGKVDVGAGVPADLSEVAWDPQTSGGLLISVPAGKADALERELRTRGTMAAARIGTVTEYRGKHLWLT